MCGLYCGGHHDSDRMAVLVMVSQAETTDTMILLCRPPILCQINISFLAHSHTHARTRTFAHAHTRTHTHSHTHTHRRCRSGCRCSMGRWGPTITGLTPLFAGYRWPVAASFKYRAGDQGFLEVLGVFRVDDEEVVTFI